MSEENNKKDTVEQITDPKDVAGESNSKKIETAKSVKQSSKDLLTDEILHNAVVSWFEEEERALEEEMKNAEPHVFSAEFERKMEEIMRVQKRKNKLSNIIRYVASAASVVLLVFALLFVGNEDLRASKFRIDVLKWMEEFFVVENDTDRDKDDQTDVLFEESRIGYMLEGFEKVEEEVTHSKVFYRYQNDVGEYINISVYRKKTLTGVDNTEIEQDIKINESGFEYRYAYKTDLGKHIFTWTDKNGRFYFLSGSVEKEKVKMVMDGITY